MILNVPLVNCNWPFVLGYVHESSPTTWSRVFAYYLESRREILEAMGVSVIAKKLPPEAVKYVCEDYCIDLPPHLQDQKALAKAPEYLRKAIYANF